MISNYDAWMVGMMIFNTFASISFLVGIIILVFNVQPVKNSVVAIYVMVKELKKTFSKSIILDASEIMSHQEPVHKPEDGMAKPDAKIPEELRDKTLGDIEETPSLNTSRKTNPVRVGGERQSAIKHPTLSKLLDEKKGTTPHEGEGDS